MGSPANSVRSFFFYQFGLPQIYQNHLSPLIYLKIRSFDITVDKTLSMEQTQDLSNLDAHDLHNPGIEGTHHLQQLMEG
jgi:hypothetical protein